jgi:low temperature requirement protein LtrA
MTAHAHLSSEREEVSVSTLELFFDLVFVFTLTQLTQLLTAEPTLEGVLRVVLMFVVLFWMYGGYVWLTNRVPPDDNTRRLLMIGAMGAFLMCALAVPSAFGGGGLILGLGYLLVVLVHIGLYTPVLGRSVAISFGSFNILTAVTVLVAALLPTPASYVFWVLALVIQYFTQARASSSAGSFEIQAGHFVERHGLLLIVALGESVVAVGIGIGELPLDPGVIGAALLGLALSAALWWSYFAADDEQAAQVMAAAAMADRFRLAIAGFFYAFAPMLLGIVAIAAGVKKSLGHIGEVLEPGPAVILGAGLATYLVGDALFRRVFGMGPIAPRLVVALLALLTVPLGLAVNAGAQLVALVVLLVGVLALEEVRRSRPAEAPGTA